MSASGIANSECTDGGGSVSSHVFGHILNVVSAPISKSCRRSKSTGQLTSTF